ncbi:N-6 DNA methylase [Streptomyces antibioticus]|uniref:N-6 DNA methylase n=1 Tax=Streptomyces antibioticus TaxID=1890 RepID=UPI003D71525B
MQYHPPSADDDSAPFLPGVAPTVTPRPVPNWVTKAKTTQARREAVAARRRKRFAAPNDPHQHASKIAENVMEAWYSHHGGSRMDIPLGTVAALTFFREPLIADWLLTLEPAQIPGLLKEVWGVQWFFRPDLIEQARPLHRWVEEDPDEHQLRAVQAVIHAAVNTGLLDITADNDPYMRSRTDVISPLLTGLRHKSDKKWRGEYHTPASVADLMARILVPDDAKPGSSFREPCIGSGSMFRSVAQHLREHNLDPADYLWFGNDIDRLSTACAAVNAILWNLGPQVAIWCANTFSNSEEDGVTKALAERAAVIKHRNDVVDQAVFEHKTRRMINALDRLLEGAAA